MSRGRDVDLYTTNRRLRQESEIHGARQYFGVGGRSWVAEKRGGGADVPLQCINSASTLRQHCVNSVLAPVPAQLLTRVSTCFGPGANTLLVRFVR